ncbi:MAG TPA: HAD family phosphatase [Solirubrobacteraceae bacterium]|nr:HAD family phosphatase [Solirubrobacteraceae bacterium]
MSAPTAILDVDGTLVDSNYQHALAWYRAFRLHGLTIPIWRCHRAIGMGGDQLVPYLAGEGFDTEHGADVRSAEHILFEQMIAEVQPFAGARGLLEDLKARGCKIVLASSAKPGDIAHFMDLLDARDLADGWTDSSAVERTKPEPDLVKAALDLVGGGPGVMVGDSTWDVTAAKKLKVPTVCVRTGGFGADELLDAGATEVFDSIAELREGLPKTPFG